MVETNARSVGMMRCSYFLNGSLHPRVVWEPDLEIVCAFAPGIYSP